MTNILKINYPQWNAANQEWEYKFIDLLPHADISGMALTSWTAQQQAYSAGAIFPPRYQQVTETIQINLVGCDQDDIFIELKAFFEGAKAIAEYWLERDPTVPAPYLEVKAHKEANARYAVIVERPSLTTLGEPIQQPFYNLNSAILEDITLSVVRLEWRSSIPGTGAALLLSSTADDNIAIGATVSTTNMVKDVISLLVTSGGSVLAGLRDDGEIWRSTDNAVTYSLVYTFASGIDVTTIIETPNYIFANVTAGHVSGSDSLVRSNTDGASWSLVTMPASTYSVQFIYYGTFSNRLWVANLTSLGGLQLFYSTDDGGSWTTISLSVLYSGSGIYDLLEYSETELLLYQLESIWASSDAGLTWSMIYANQTIPSLGTPRFRDLIKLSTGEYLIGALGAVVKMTGFAESFEFIEMYARENFNTPKFNALIEYDGYVYASTSGDGYILRAPLSNLSQWVALNILFPNYPTSDRDMYVLGQLDSNKLIFGGGYDDGIIVVEEGRTVTLDFDLLRTYGMFGISAVPICNKCQDSNITHVKFFDSSAGTYTELLPASSYPVDIFGSDLDSSDITYFISETFSNDTPFSNIVFYLSQRILAINAQIQWEYYNGSWVQLSTLDQEFILDNPVIEKTGICVEAFEIPADWVAVTVDGVTGLTVRARINFVFKLGQVPQQSNFDIFSAGNSYVDIGNELGDMDAITKLIVENVSNNLDGGRVDVPILFSNRLIAGKRKLSRGSAFSPFLNAKDYNNTSEILTTLGTNVTFQTSVTSITGEYARYNPSGVEAMADRVTWSLNNVLSLQYIGAFHVYVRIHQTAGSAGDFDVQLKVIYGSGGLNFTSESVQPQSTTRFELLDLGTINIPKFDSLTDTLQFVLQASAASGTPNLDIFDLILIPVDEWAGDYTDSANVSGSEIGNGEKLEVSGLVQRLEIPVTVKNNLGAIKSEYETSGPPLYIEPLPDDTQRLHFLQAQASTTGSDFVWIAKPEICSIVTIEHNPGYMGFS